MSNALVWVDFVAATVWAVSAFILKDPPRWLVRTMCILLAAYAVNSGLGKLL